MATYTHFGRWCGDELVWKNDKAAQSRKVKEGFQGNKLWAKF
jgi:hypothetical protein